MYIIIIFLLQLLHHTDTVVHVFKLIFKSVFIQVSFKSFIFYMSTFTFYILTSASFCNTSSLPFLILHTNDSHLKKKKDFPLEIIAQLEFPGIENIQCAAVAFLSWSWKSSLNSSCLKTQCLGSIILYLCTYIYIHNLFLVAAGFGNWPPVSLSSRCWIAKSFR